ncbi:MAG: hypothetical protein ACETWO_02450 [Candidatus Hadarchaeaceae archaeon]|nr:hypothetical protein [Hadesarchaea archaeon]MDH5684941.1 hypothetical protein [Hadesarchaea archaeon]
MFNFWKNVKLEGSAGAGFLAKKGKKLKGKETKVLEWRGRAQRREGLSTP